MDLKLEVVLSSSIKRKKPWPRFCWLGQEKESVFLLDDNRISEINMVSGHTKKRIPKLHPLLNSVVTMSSSHNGMWLCGLLGSGELFLWNRDRDILKTAASVPDVVDMITAVKGHAAQPSVQVSGDGMRVLLTAKTGQVLMWECRDRKDLTVLRDGSVRGHWSDIQPLQDTLLPAPQDKEASQHTVFVKTESMGDTCLSAFVFTSGKKFIITCLKIQWEESPLLVGSVGYSVGWATRTYAMAHLSPSCQVVKSRGALLPAFSPDGRLLAVVLNQRQPKATQVLFVSTHNFVSISSSLGGCGSGKTDIPRKYIRSHWVGSMSWSPNGLFLACVLKRGSLLILGRLGGLLSLTSSGCNVDLGPAHFLPLHPLVTYRVPVSAGTADPSLSSSSVSVQDVMRQRYSVTWHPRLLYLIVSDGYMATVLRVLGRPTPALWLKTLLKETNKDLERASHILDESQLHWKTCLESIDNNFEEFRSSVTCVPNTTDSVLSADESTLPLFLQNQGTFGGTKELLEKVQTFFEDDSDMDGNPAGAHAEDGGRLEFATMFDTLHALDTRPSPDRETAESERSTQRRHGDLGRIQSRLLTAWAFSLSMGNTVENRAHLMKYTLHCVVRFTALLCLTPTPTAHPGKRNPSVSTRLLHLLRTLLCFLSWDSTHSPHCLGLLVELSKQLIGLLLTPKPDANQTGQLSSDTLTSAVLVLKLVSDSLDRASSLKQRPLWSSAEKDSVSQSPKCWPSDVYYGPLLQDDKDQKSAFVWRSLPVPQRPSSRLFGGWQWLHEISQQYMEKLKGFKGCEGWEEEQQRLSVIAAQIQVALQSTGEKLDKEDPALLSCPGEHLFLLGLYSQSTDTWRSQIWEESKRTRHRSVFLETRLCLALLYSLLSQYHLRQAQQLGEHMAHVTLHRAGHHVDATCATAQSPSRSWLPMDLHWDTACAVIQTLGRFMASYFTNQPLYILPPHNVAVLPPVHLPHAPGVGRLVPLCQEQVARAVREQQMSDVWTVDYAQDLLMLGGLIPESVWLAYHLGDWKTASSLSLAYNHYCTAHFDFTRFKKRELHLPADLEPERIFQTELECLLGNKKNDDDDKTFTDPLEGEDRHLLHVSIQEILKASVMAGVNVLSFPLSSLLTTVKDLCSCLPALVHSDVYLPAPPLYCPQPSPNTQDPEGPSGRFAEVVSRQKVSAVLQRLLLLLRAAHCSYPAAQWYVSSLRRARHVLHKIQKRYCYPSATEEEKAFPEGLMKFVTSSGFFRPRPSQHLDPDAVHTISCFRELCALCWMLHVRDQLSISCRKYQTSRQVSGEAEARAACVDALRWARRFLPFSHFLNAEEILQDVLLSLVSEVPPTALVAETLAHAFPEEEESVRVPLRGKYNCLLQRLRQCNVLEEEKVEAGEVMMIAIQDKLRQRRKHLGRVQRHLAPPELHLWEKEEEEEDKGSKHAVAMLGQLSLGTSLSTSTLTDHGFPTVCSDGDAVESPPAGVSPDPHGQVRPRRKKCKDSAKRPAVKMKRGREGASDPAVNKDRENRGDEAELPSLPVVGTWEFELEDDEYLTFLELFLSYVLEKDGAGGVDSVGEPPLLKPFCSMLRARELHSLTFDVLTTLHRRQGDGQHPMRKQRCCDPPVFRAGGCHRPSSAAWSEGPGPRKASSAVPHPGLRPGRPSGLFGLRQRSSALVDRRQKRWHSGSDPYRGPSESSFGGSSVEAVMDLQQVLDPKLEAQFPELGRLLEWMLRWADRRVLLGHRSKRKRASREGFGEAADEGVMIRMKASAPSVLTSLSLLERKFSALLGTDSFSAHIPIPETRWTVSPVLQPEVEKRLERESRVDTGYPASANTPTTGGDHNLQQEPSISEGHTEGPGEVIFPRRTSPLDSPDEHTSADQSGLFSSPQPSCDEAEREDVSSDNEDGDLSSIHSSGSSCGDSCATEMSLKHDDLDVSVKNLTSSPPLHAGLLQAPPHPQPQALPSAPREEPARAELFEPTGAQTPDPPVNPTQLQPTADAPTGVGVRPNLPSSTDTHQRLGEDLIRLVQNINYMSLMEVLGASFSNLQVAQQNSSRAHSNMNASTSDAPSSCALTLMPPQSASRSQTAVPAASQTHSDAPKSESNNPRLSEAPASRDVHEFPPQSSANNPSHIGNPARTAQLLGAASLDFHPLSVQAESPETQFRESRTLIPFSQGLLTTTHTRHSVPSVPDPVSAPFKVNIQTPSQFKGLKLIQLHDPPLNHPTPSQPATSKKHPPQLRHRDGTAAKKAEKKSPCGSVSLNRSHDPDPRRSHPQNPTSEQPEPPELSLHLPPLPDHRPSLAQGLRLLHPQPVQHSGPDVTLPKFHAPAPSRPFSVFVPSTTHPPSIKLLHVDSGPQPMWSPAARSAKAIHLMSVEELTGLRTRRHNAEGARLPRRADTSPIGDFSKRQKRRKTAVTANRPLKPTEQIIPTQEQNHEPLQPTPAGQDAGTPTGSSVSLLRGQSLLDKAMSTAAELHAFASTCKRPPRCQDAFTTTDPACAPPASRASVTASSARSGNTPSPRECPAGETVERPPSPQVENLEQPSHRFLSVLDLEDGSRHQDLPDVSPETQEPTPISPSTFCAERHVVAASVLRDAEPVVDPQACDKILIPDVGEEPPALSHVESRREPERVMPQETFGASDCELVKAIKKQNPGLPAAASTPPTVWFSSRLSQLDTQLAALQNIADNLEVDYTKSRMVHDLSCCYISPDIVKFAPVLAPGVRTAKKSVRLSVPVEGVGHSISSPESSLRPRYQTVDCSVASAPVLMSKALSGPKTIEDHQETPEEEYLVQDDSPSLERKISLFISTSSPSHNAAPSHLHTPPELKQLTDAAGISQIWEDEALGQTGLSDTAELLDGLVKEGYLSLTDLDMSSSHRDALDSRRPEQQQQEKGWRSQKRPEDERRELRVWMRRKQRERMAVYQKNRQTLMEMERKPFIIAKSTNKKQPNAEDQEKVMILEQYNQRTQEASYLASDFRASLLSQPRAPVRSTTSAPPTGSVHRVPSVSASARDLKSQLGPTQHRRRLGLHRPVTSLPRGRMCQITRRGMVTCPNSHTKPQPSSQDEERHAGPQRRTGLTSTPSGWGVQRQPSSTTDKARPWGSFSRTLTLSGPQVSDTVLAGVLGELDNDARAGLSGLDLLDNLSESSTTLSKIDWAAIERIVAGEDT